MADPYCGLNTTCLDYMALGYISITDSDGDSEMLPCDEQEVVGVDGTVDYTKEASSDAIKQWQRKIATMLVLKALNDVVHNRRLVFQLRDFPAGYKLYVHRKGQRSSPRTDYYLYGSKSEHCRQFRSPAEFVMHAKWLAYGKPKDSNGHTLCECTYCSGVDQKVITRKLVGAPPISRRVHTNERGVKRLQGAVIAKDYTKLNEGGGVGKWEERGEAITIPSASANGRLRRRSNKVSSA